MPNKAIELIEVPVTRQYTHLVQLYEAMVAESTDRIYTGKVVDTFNTLSISMAYYTPLFNALKELGCIQLLDRGVRGRPTQYRLHHAPDKDAYIARYESDLTRRTKPATMTLSELEQRMKNLERRLQGLEIKQVIANFEERIMRLEKEGGSK